MNTKTTIVVLHAMLNAWINKFGCSWQEFPFVGKSWIDNLRERQASIGMSIYIMLGMYMMDKEVDKCLSLCWQTFNEN